LGRDWTWNKKGNLKFKVLYLHSDTEKILKTILCQQCNDNATTYFSFISLPKTIKLFENGFKESNVSIFYNGPSGVVVRRINYFVHIFIDGLFEFPVWLTFSLNCICCLPQSWIVILYFVSFA
jgi:hypothetical protein